MSPDRNYVCGGGGGEGGGRLALVSQAWPNQPWSFEPRRSGEVSQDKTLVAAPSAFQSAIYASKYLWLAVKTTRPQTRRGEINHGFLVFHFWATITHLHHVTYVLIGHVLKVYIITYHI